PEPYRLPTTTALLDERSARRPAALDDDVGPHLVEWRLEWVGRWVTRQQQPAVRTFDIRPGRAVRGWGRAGQRRVHPVDDRRHATPGVGVHLVAAEHRVPRAGADVVAVVIGRREGSGRRPYLLDHHLIPLAAAVPP